MREEPGMIWHERAYLLLWISLSAALASKGVAKASDFAIAGGQVLALLGLARLGKQGPWWQARMWLPLIALNVTYFWLGDAIPRLNDWRADWMLRGVDRALFGDCLAFRVKPLISLWTREILSVAYLSFFPLWLGGLLLAGFRGKKNQRAFFSGLHLIYVIGFAGYALFPAAGPFRYPPLAEQAGFPHPGGFFTRINDSVVQNGCNSVDVFPSLHTAITVFVFLSAWSWSRRLGSWLVVPCLLIICATIALQYHYAADLAAGALLGVGTWRFTTFITIPANKHHDRTLCYPTPRPGCRRPRPERRQGSAASEATPRGLPRAGRVRGER